MKIIKDVSEMRALAKSARGRGEAVALVPTMGCLHEGHIELVRAAKGAGGLLALSIFVNPKQFGPREDYDRYPRVLDKDSALAASEGVDVVFAPDPEQMYPEGFDTYVEPGMLANRLCGLSRPGHFRGVLTVVLKLFNVVMPAKAFFGRKDYQQQLLIRKMAGDLNLDVEIVTVDTVREADGLALSSRNSYLAAAERKAAAAIPRALEAAAQACSRGLRDAAELELEMKKVIDNEPLASVEYIKVCDAATLEDLSLVKDKALAAVAVRIGATRLIDNRILGD